MQKARRHHFAWLRPLVSTRFQVLLHSVVHGSFHLSFTVLVHYRSLGSIQPCQMVLADSDRIPPVPPYSGSYYANLSFLIQDFHLLRSIFPNDSYMINYAMSQSYNPKYAVTSLVWALSVSLTTTPEIILIFSSYGYLDVSVPHVRPAFRGDKPSAYRVPPFGYPRIYSYLPIPVAFRSLSRPSSPPRAQASPVYSQ